MTQLIATHGAPKQVPWLQTKQGGRIPAPHGWQQSEVCVQPAVKPGTQVGSMQVPVMSGRLCWQTNPGAHTGGGARMLPPQGPPTSETQPHVAAVAGRL